MRRTCLFLALGVLAGCAIHDWSGYTSGDETTTPTDGGGADPVADPRATGDSDAGALDPYGREVAADRPLLWYRFDDEAGSPVVADATGTHPARVTGKGTPAFRQAGVAGNGVLLDGKTILDVGDAFDFAGQVPFTLEAWIEVKSTDGDQRFFYKRDDYHSPVSGYVAYLGRDLSPHFEASGPNVALSAWDTKAIPTGQWTHYVVVVTYASGKGNSFVYVNGAQGAAHGFDSEANLLDTPQHLEIADRLTGTLDEVAIYDAPLPQARILRHYLAGLGE